MIDVLRQMPFSENISFYSKIRHLHYIIHPNDRIVNTISIFLELEDKKYGVVYKYNAMFFTNAEECCPHSAFRKKWLRFLPKR